MLEFVYVLGEVEPPEAAAELRQGLIPAEHDLLLIIQARDGGGKESGG